MEKSNKNILVIGGGGYIGSHVCRILSDKGYVPISYDNYSTGYKEFIKFGPSIEGDVSDALLLKNSLIENNISAVIYLAASIEVGESICNPIKYYKNNLTNVISFCDVLRDTFVKAVVFSSTAAVYGEPQIIPIPEDHAKLPINPYGTSKWMAERVFSDFYAVGGVPCIPLRYFNACGADPSGDIGEAHDPETHLIPRACLAALARVPPLQVFGSDFSTLDGTALRDYVHVLDLARAHVLAMEYLLHGGSPRPFNLGQGKETSVLEVIRAVESVSGRAVPHVMSARRVGDPERLSADISLAQKVLGWHPNYTDIHSIVETAWNWHKNRN